MRHFLPTIRGPTLALHRTGDLVATIENARNIAGRIPGASLVDVDVEVPGDEYILVAGDDDRLLEESERFTASVRPVPDPARVLATVRHDSLPVIPSGVGPQTVRLGEA